MTPPIPPKSTGQSIGADARFEDGRERPLHLGALTP